MPGDSHRDLVHQTWLEQESLDLVLVPVWVLALRYREDRGLLRVEFGYPMTPSTDNLLVVEPELAGVWQREGKTALIMYYPGLLGNTTYTFRLSGNPTTADGTTLPGRSGAWPGSSPCF